MVQQRVFNATDNGTSTDTEAVCTVYWFKFESFRDQIFAQRCRYVRRFGPFETAKPLLRCSSHREVFLF
ncbi:hypothetical protein O181_080410 [Austropuccinia psidii MF-1]|uniref:Uncharacterized protein n=1 Tax=Austropuccinia psidii MF-1 TaxID=1389203 RepID=A0A9Q3FN52_9BASI|nr:hypothetical protein [Austropuccinia psidii MF-1]